MTPEQNKQYLLCEDITSNYQDRGRPIVYGKRGEKVTEIADHGNVKIVIGKDGTRFPVAVGKLNEL